MSQDASPVGRLVAEVRQSAKYRAICPALIASLGERELAQSSLREAVKTVKRKLHQVGAAYALQPMRYTAWLQALTAAQAQGEESLRAVCRQIMAAHASSRERLSILDRFYAEALAPLGPLDSVLDVACGLNPLAAPWMPLAPGARYVAYDIYTDLMPFLQGFMDLIGLHGEALALDVLRDLPTHEAMDCALLLKAIPCLEQLDPMAGARLLRQLPARHMLVSFPVASLGGRRKGMPMHYEQHLQALLAGEAWRVQRFAFETELAFLISKD